MNLLYSFDPAKKFTVVSYYTLDEIYSEEIKRLVQSLKKFKLNYYIEGISPLGDWKTCTDYKATFIKRAIERIPTPIVFIDADGEVVSYPKLFDTLDCDIAAFINHINSLLSGTLYIANTAKTKKLIDRWIDKNAANTSLIFEQRILHGVIKTHKNIVFKKLPIGYCQIHNYKFRDDNPTIIHWQASRRTKKLYEALEKLEVQKLIKNIEKESEKNWLDTLNIIKSIKQYEETNNNE